MEAHRARKHALAVSVLVATAVLVWLCVRAAKRSRRAAQLQAAAATTSALTTHNFMAPDVRATHAPLTAPMSSGNVWTYNLGDLGFTRHVRALSSWYTPPDQAVKTDTTPLGMYSVQLYANGVLGNLSLVATNFTFTRGLTLVIFASMRIAAFRGESDHTEQPLGAYSTVWVHRFPITVRINQSPGGFVLTVPSTSDIATDMPTLAARLKHISGLASVGDKDVPAVMSDTTRAQIEAVVPLAFNKAAAEFWSRHIRIHAPMYSQFAGGQRGLSSLVDVYNAVSTAVMPRMRFIVGANGGAERMTQGSMKYVGNLLQDKFAQHMPDAHITVTPADLYEMLWVASQNRYSSDTHFVVLDTPGIGTCGGKIEYPSGTTPTNVERYSLTTPFKLTAVWSGGWDNGVYVLESETANEVDVWTLFNSKGFADTMPWKWPAAPTREDALLMCA